MKLFTLIVLMINTIILQGCFVVPGPIGVVGEYGSAVVQPNPLYISGESSYYYTTPQVYTTPRVYSYSPYAVHVPPPIENYRPNTIYYPPRYHHHGGYKPPPYRDGYKPLPHRDGYPKPAPSPYKY